MKIKTSELSGVALDWAVAQVDEVKTIMLAPKKDEPKKPFALFGSIALPVGGENENGYSPSTCWHCGGPLIERFEIDISRNVDLKDDREMSWSARPDDGETFWHCGATPLIAACRAIVAAKLGDEVDVPEGMV